MAVISLLGKSLKESLDSRDQIIAGLLAQESIELVRNIRDNNWVTTGNSFDRFPTSAIKDNCRIDKDYDYSSGAVLQCDIVSFDGYALKMDSNGFYSHNGPTATKFHRKGIITDIGAGAEKKVTSMMIWSRNDFPALGNCGASEKCAYTEVVLTKWGES